MGLSNYPPGVTGNEPQIAGGPIVTCPSCDCRTELLDECENCGESLADVDPYDDSDPREPDEPTGSRP